MKRSNVNRVIRAPARSCAALLLALFTIGWCKADEPTNLAAGTAFRSALEQPFSPTWDHIDLRVIVRAVEEGPRVAILLDRRIDPTAERSFKVSSDTLRECFDRLAAECDAGATIIGSVVYIGPRSSAEKLRTLVALRRAELKDLQIPESRRNVLTRGKPFRWDDLDRPADVVRRIAEEYRLEVQGVDQIPHDLWAAAALPDAAPVEALSLVLAQFDLSFQWTDETRGVRLEPVPERVAIEKPHDPPRGMSPADAVIRWQEEIPGLEARGEGNKVIVSGTEELHELVERVRRGSRASDKGRPRAAAPLKPLKLQRYSGRIQNKPVGDLLRSLETPGQGLLTFEYDRAEFKAAGIDLNQRINIEFKNAKIEELLKLALGPLGVTVEIQDRTVRLKPVQ
ncbi:MAG TPA: STN domain-containing protein [Planctomycetaceae bacterium]|jgi:hypothetical protein